MNAALISFHGDEAIKRKYLRRVEAHRKADELVQGTGWEQNGVTRGCAVGCIFDAYDHSRGPVEIGAPEWLLRLADTIHEGLPRETAIGKGPKTSWPRRFLDAIPVGVNLEPVRWKFALVLLGENAKRVRELQIDEPLKQQVLDAIEKCRHVNQQAIETGSWDESAARSAESAARSAARSAESAARSAESAAWSAARSAESAARSAAWSAESAARSAESAARSAESAAWSAAWSAESAAWSAARSAESAARSAAWSAAWSATRSAESAAYIRYADALLLLLAECGQ